MKKILALLLAAIMLLSVVACTSDPADPKDPVDPVEPGENDPVDPGEDDPADPGVDANVTIAPTVEEGTMGHTMWDAFMQTILANPTISAEEMANTLISNPAIQFFGAAMPIEAGMLQGFGEYEVSGFTSGAMFAPMMGSIAFVGYVFELEEGADVQAFINNLNDNCNPRWQICVTADQTVVGAFNNMVMFLMCPASLGDAEPDGGEVEDATLIVPTVEADTTGAILWDAFVATKDANPTISAPELANTLICNEIIPFMGGAMEIEPGLLQGFDNYEVGGFTSGAFFGPMMGSIAFVGYIFEVEEGIDVENWLNALTDAANPVWQVCVSADQVVAGAYGNTVFFLMCPAQMAAE